MPSAPGSLNVALFRSEDESGATKIKARFKLDVNDAKIQSIVDRGKMKFSFTSKGKILLAMEITSFEKLLLGINSDAHVHKRLQARLLKMSGDYMKAPTPLLYNFNPALYTSLKITETDRVEELKPDIRVSLRETLRGSYDPPTDDQSPGSDWSWSETLHPPAGDKKIVSSSSADAKRPMNSTSRVIPMIAAKPRETIDDILSDYPPTSPTSPSHPPSPSLASNPLSNNSAPIVRPSVLPQGSKPNQQSNPNQAPVTSLTIQPSVPSPTKVSAVKARVPITSAAKARETLDEILEMGSSPSPPKPGLFPAALLLKPPWAPAPEYRLPAAVENTLEELIDKIGEIYTRVGSIEKKVDGVEKMQQRMASILEAESDRVAKVELTLSRIELNEEIGQSVEKSLMIDLGGYKASITGSLSEVLERISALEHGGASSNASNQFHGTESTLAVPATDAATAKRIGEIEKRLAMMEARENIAGAKYVALIDFKGVQSELKNVVSRVDVVEEIQSQALASAISSPSPAAQQFSIQQMVDFDDRIQELEKKMKSQVEILPQIVSKMRLTEEAVSNLRKAEAAPSSSTADLKDRLTKLALVCAGLNQRISKLTGETL